MRVRNGRVFYYTLYAICCTLSFLGCGYSTSRLLPAAYRTVYVEPFRNSIAITEETGDRLGLETTVPQIEETVTQEVIKRFLFDGNLRVTTKREEADLILEGALTSFYRQGLRRLEDNTIEEYRLNLSASLRLHDRKGKQLFSEPNLVGDATYFAAGASAVAESTAVTKLVEDFSRRVVERVIEDW